MLADTAHRVSQNTDDEINCRIQRQIESSVAWHAHAGHEALNRRLAELDQEWDIERCLETMAPSLTLFGLFMGLTRNRLWLVIPTVVQSFFLQHALQGWCPPIPVLRRLGFRTMEEINQERMALKALRGDFGDISTAANAIGNGVASVMEAVRR